MCHAINVSQSDFIGNYRHAAIRGKTRRKQNRTLAGMSAKSDFGPCLQAGRVSTLAGRSNIALVYKQNFTDRVTLPTGTTLRAW